MFFQRRTVPGLAAHSYLIGDLTTNKAVVIDPVRDVKEYAEIAEKQGLKICHILETHVHADFVSGSKELKALLKGLPIIHCSGEGGEKWTASYADRVVKEGDEIQLGSLTFQAVHTPGHTPEHVMWALYEEGRIKALFTGDFLFVNDVGRPDLLGKEEMENLSRKLCNSLFSKLKPFPDSTEIFPAHGAGSLCGKSIGEAASSTLGEERRKNKAMIEKPEDVWIKDLIKEMPPIPRYFSQMKRVNVSGAKVLGSKLPGQKALSPEFAKKEIEKGAVVVDVRTKEAFSQEHIPGSFHLSFCPQMATWAGWILPENPKIILLLEEEKELIPILQGFLRVGIDDILGYIKGGKEGWKKEIGTIRSLKTLSTKDLNQMIEKGAKPYILDVRADNEWGLGHIAGAVHIFGGLVHENLEKLPKDQPLFVICNSGFRASAVCSLLFREGFNDVSNVLYGMAEWKERQFPVV